MEIALKRAEFTRKRVNEVRLSKHRNLPFCELIGVRYGDFGGKAVCMPREQGIVPLCPRPAKPPFGCRSEKCAGRTFFDRGAFVSFAVLV